MISSLQIAVAIFLAAGILPGESVTVETKLILSSPDDHLAVVASLRAEPPPESKVPADGPGVQYIHQAFGDMRQLLVAAVISGDRPWFRIDRNFDGHLVDDERRAFEEVRGLPTATVELPLRFKAGDPPLPVRLQFKVSPWRDSQLMYLTVPIHREGVVTLEGRQRRVALFDGNCDLSFGDSPDYLVIDLNGDGRLDRALRNGERIDPGQPFRLGGSGYTADHLDDHLVRITRLKGEPPAPRLSWVRTHVPPTGVEAPGGSDAEHRRAAQDLAEAIEKDRRSGVSTAPCQTAVLPRIGALGTEEAFTLLLGVLQSHGPVLARTAAVLAMAYRNYLPHADLLATVARESGPANVRGAALYALHRMGAPDLQKVCEDLVRREYDEHLFSKATLYLAYCGTPRAFELLRETAISHRKHEFRHHAYLAFTSYREIPPDAALVRDAANSDDPRLQALALEHAFRLGIPEARSLALWHIRSTDPAVRLSAAKILAIAGDQKAVQALLRLDSPAPELRELIVSLVGAVRFPATLELLARSLQGKQAAERALVAEIAAGIPLPMMTEALTARLAVEKDSRVLKALMQALARHGATSALEAMVVAAKKTKKDPVALAGALEALVALGSEHPDVLRFLERLLASGKPEVRLLALAAVTKVGTDLAADLLLGAVADKVWSVRLVAVQGLGRVRVKRAVPVLITCLEKDGSPRVREEIAKTLYLITGQNFYDLVELWKNWWEEEGESFRVPPQPPDILNPDAGQASRATFYGIPVRSNRIVFVIDQSGSMLNLAGKETRFECALRETRGVVEQIRKDAWINVIFFESAVHPWKRKLVPLTRATRKDLDGFLSSKAASGGTNLYDALEMALLMKEVDTVFVLSDGLPEAGRFVLKDDIVREIGEINRTRKVAIHCIAVGHESEVLMELAKANGGRYVQR